MAMQIQSDEIISQQHEIETLKKQNEWLKQQFNLNRQREFGRSTEKSAASQITLFDEKMDGSGEEAEVPGEQETIIYTRTKTPKTKGRNIDLSRFPKEQVIYDLSDTEKTCTCG